MELERLSVRLRPRKPWEAADLGFAMVRAWGASIYLPWLVLTVPTALALIWTLHFWGLLVFWWLLPLFEAVALYPLSRAVFGELPTARRSLRAAPGEMRRAWREIALRRLYPARSFALPIGQLEGLKGRERRERRSVLSAAIDVHGGITIVFVCFQWLLLCAVLALAVFLTPSWLGVDWGYVFERLFEGQLPRWGHDLLFSLWALILVAIDPYYVAAGFGLYLDRRTALEGWDLEIELRRLARRLRPPAGSRDDADAAGRRVHRAALWWLLACLGCQVAAPARAEEPNADLRPEEIVVEAPREAPDDAPEDVPEDVSGEQIPPPPDGWGDLDAPSPDVAPASWSGPEDEDPRRFAEAITSDPKYGGEVTIERWQLRPELLEWLEEEPDEATAPNPPSPLLLAIAWTLLQLSEMGLWLLLGIVLLVVVIAAVRRWPTAGRRSPEVGADAPETLFGLDLRAETLPDDIPGTAESMWRSGDPAGALGLLYRGSLARLTDEGVSLAESFTEDDCLRAAGAALEPERHDYFAGLTRVWQLAAYGQRFPAASDGERWWSGWSRNFGPARARGTGA